MNSGRLFGDCEPGAVPALGDAYGIQVIWDDDLKYTSDIYIEAGDHEHLIRIEPESLQEIDEVPASLHHQFRQRGRRLEVLGKDLQSECCLISRNPPGQTSMHLPHSLH